MALAAFTDSHAAVRFTQPLRLPCGLTLRNRIIRAAAFAGGSVGEQAATHGEVAAGGAALTTIAYTSVSGDGRTFAEQLLLTPQGAPPDLHTIARAAHAHGCLVSFQLTHAGSFAEKSLLVRDSGPGTAAAGSAAADKRALAPASVFDVTTLSFPRQCTEADMDRLEQDFAAAARTACTKGEADAVEVHLGHGYLLSQWLCPLTNNRSDEHGGSAANRLKFPLRIVRAVREAIGPTKALFVKINTHDGFDGGVSPADVEYYCRTLCAERMPVHAGGAGGGGTATGEGEPTGSAGSMASPPPDPPTQPLIDGLIPSAGFVSKNGFFMLRGAVPRKGMARALARTSKAKAAAFRMLGRWLVPELPFTPGFLLEGARAVLQAVQGTGVPVIAIGGFVDLKGVEGALAKGFAAVQMARALIREPDLPLRWQRHVETSLAVAGKAEDGSAAGATAASAAAGSAPSSLCSHCNTCVLAALTPEVPSRCVERPPATAGSSGVGQGRGVADIEDAARP